MSDYLGHLLERSFAPTPEVRPQVPSLFEPKPAGEQTKLRFSSLEDDRATVGENPQKTNPSTNHGDNLQAPPSDEDQRRNIAAEKIEASIKSPSAREESPRGSTFEIPAKQTVKATSRPINSPLVTPPFHPEKRDNPVVTDSVQPLTRQENSKPAPVGTRPAAGEVVDFRADRAERRYGDRRPPSFPLSHQPLRDDSEATNTLRPREEVGAPNDFRPARAVKTTAVLPLAVASSREKNIERKEIAGASHAAVPPSIQVTIGRVEIRATPPPVVTRAAPRKESGLSLENYLQRRAGGQS